MSLAGQTVAVIAPAGIVEREGLQAGIGLLEGWGLKVRTGAHVYDRFRYLAGTHEDRAADLAWALGDPSIDIVWAARGGSGSVHCLPALPHVVAGRKTLVGYSDLTAMFCALRKVPGLRLVHGPTLSTLATVLDARSREQVKAVLDGTPVPALPLQRLAGAAAPLRGPLVGGNLTVLASLAGTPWQLDARGAVVVLEDVTELAYRLDRSLMQLRESGSFDGAAAFVLGEFIRCALPDGADFTLHQMIAELLAPLGVPVFAGMPVGHGATNLAWRYGEPVVIEADGLRFSGEENRAG